MLVRIRDHLRRASDGMKLSDTSATCTVCCIFAPRASSLISQTATVQQALYISDILILNCISDHLNNIEKLFI